MDPELAKSWIDVLTQGKGLIITAALIIMLAGTSLTGFVLAVFAWRAGVWDWFKRLVISLENMNGGILSMKDAVDVLKQVCKDLKEDRPNG